MTFLTSLALRYRSVTILSILLVMIAGVFSYQTIKRELFPPIEFPNITIATFYPSANPEAVEREVTDPIEDAIAGMDGLQEIRSTSSENLSLVLATFNFGIDMDEAERTIEGNINGLSFPDGVSDPVVSRINSDVFPVMQLSVGGDRDLISLQRLVDDVIIPPLERLEGVFEVRVLGRVDEEVRVELDPARLEKLGLSGMQVANAIRDNHRSVPAGSVNTNGTSIFVRAAHRFGSVEELRDLVVGFEAVPDAPPGNRPVRLGDVADVQLTSADATTISRTNGQASLNVAILKDPDSNTVDVTDATLARLAEIKQSLPPDIEVLTLSNDGPEIKKELSQLQREGILGFLFAVLVVFAFLLNLRPGLLRGAALTLRPTLIIGLSIPLSIFTGVLFMNFAGLTLNFMTLAGLAIAVGRVVDDSIVVMENIYRHIQQGEEGLSAALSATREVGTAIVSSTLTNVVVFVPLAFIQGLVGSFFAPFAWAVTFTLLASALVALTAVPVLGGLLLRRGDLAEEVGSDDVNQNTVLQRLYEPAIVYALRHKAVALLAALVVTVASLMLLLIIPVTLFPAGTPQYLTIGVELPTGTALGPTFAVVHEVEKALEQFAEEGHVEAYQVTLGSGSDPFGPGVGGGSFNEAGFFVKLHEGVPPDIADRLRAAMPSDEAAQITVQEISAGPPSDNLELIVTGNNFTETAAAARQLEAAVSGIEGVINVKSDVSEARDEVVARVDPARAARHGLTAGIVGMQLNQLLVGQAVAEVDLEGQTMDVILRGRPELRDDINQIKNILIEGPGGRIELGAIADIVIEKGPVSISRFDGQRSASITGAITAADTQAVGVEVQNRIDALSLPPGVSVVTGGIFQQIAEGFQDIFASMAVGVALVYLVMVISLGSLRNPFIIMLSLPLALVGALVALAITGRSLSLSALMGFLLLIGIVVTNAIVLLTFVEQLRERGASVFDALTLGARTRLRPILMTASTTIIALFPLALASNASGGIIGAELATVVIGGLFSSTVLTLIVVPVVYAIFNESIPNLNSRLASRLRRGRQLPNSAS